MLVYCVVDLTFSSTLQLGTSLETFLRLEDAESFVEDVRRDDERLEDAERFVEDVRGDEPELVRYLRIVDRELEAATRTSRWTLTSYRP